MMFGDFAALSNVSASFEPGRVHAVVGQNGAGKTTFSRVVTGLYQPTEGHIAIDAQKLAGGVVAARRQGIDMVHQNFSLPGSFTVAEALHLLDVNRSHRPYRRATIRRACEQKLARFGPAVDPGARIRDLSVQLRQGVEITRALSGDTRVLILDEPTAALSPGAVEELFARLRELAAQGVTILVVLHKLDEVWAVADTITVLRDGRVAMPKKELADVTHKEVTVAIIGEELSASSTPASTSVGADVSADDLLHELEPGHTVLPGDEHVRPAAPGKVAAGVLTLTDVSTARRQGDAALHNVSLTVRRGEVVGVAGVDGNGQQSLVEAVAGLTRVDAGSIELDDTVVTHASLLRRRRLGLRVIPFDRNTQGVSLSSAIWLNVGIADVLMSPRAWFSPRRLRAKVAESVSRWSVKHRALSQPIGELSGGNVQRAIFAREATADSRLVVAAQPTRGLDLGATAFVHRTLRQLASDGAGVLLVSADLDELRTNSDRIVVLRGGRIAADLPADASRARIGEAMVGGGDA
ncbi:ATP-binding cassette domain-containing protein [Streptomyces sp. NPDC005820]|uniref:ABC transporter ATP-binding protein n=1 Tax=Streptomyces sp. NPDC005820 TaxID=3157069 RepID=UPI0033F95147